MVSDFEQLQPTPQGEALFQEMLWVHSAIRRNLETIQRLANECVDGRAADELQAEIKELETTARSGS